MKVIKQTSKKTTYVCLVLDDSGSMAGVRQQTIDGFNEQLTALKAMENADHDVFVSVIKFSQPSDIVVLRSRVRASEVPTLTHDEYRAAGHSTALLDAIYSGIGELEQSPLLSVDGNAALLSIMTDGLENSSRTITNRELIKEKITALQATGKWTVTFMGVGSVDEITNGFGIYKGNYTPYQFGVAGSMHNTAATVSGLANYSSARSVGVTAVCDFFDVSKQEEDSEIKS